MSIEKFLSHIDPSAGWHTEQQDRNRILIRDFDRKCPINHVTGKKDIFVCVIENGVNFGLTSKDAQDIMVASDRINYLPLQELRQKIMFKCFPDLIIEDV